MSADLEPHQRQLLIDRAKEAAHKHMGVDMTEHDSGRISARVSGWDKGMEAAVDAVLGALKDWAL